MDLECFTEKILIDKIDHSNFSASVQIPSDLTVFEGHFPGQPILPGVTCVFIAEKLTAGFAGRPLKLKQLKKTKFFAPILPGSTLSVTGNVSCSTADEKTIESRITFSDETMHRICSVKMILEP